MGLNTWVVPTAGKVLPQLPEAVGEVAGWGTEFRGSPGGGVEQRVKGARKARECVTSGSLAWEEEVRSALMGL